MLRLRLLQTARTSMPAAMNKPELLAPAGDAECFGAAVQFGADAVYVGAKQYGMRAAAKNFDYRNAEMDAFPAFVKEVSACGVDAVIAADLGVITQLRTLAPELTVHASTQTGVVNYQTANALYALGVKRVVLARELSIAEIAEIRAKTPKDLEIEIFVHGAMCMSVSGRCLLSE